MILIHDSTDIPEIPCVLGSQTLHEYDDDDAEYDAVNF